MFRRQLFPGLIYRMLKPKVVLLIFVSGKIVLTGAKVRRPFIVAFMSRRTSCIVHSSLLCWDLCSPFDAILFNPG